MAPKAYVFSPICVQLSRVLPSVESLNMSCCVGVADEAAKARPYELSRGQGAAAATPARGRRQARAARRRLSSQVPPGQGQQEATSCWRRGRPLEARPPSVGGRSVDAGAQRAPATEQESRLVQPFHWWTTRRRQRRRPGFAEQPEPAGGAEGEDAHNDVRLPRQLSTAARAALAKE